MAYQVRQGQYDQGYIDYLNSLSPDDLNAIGRGRSPLITGQGIDYSTLQNFKSVMGRDPTAAEFGTYAPLGAQAGQAISQYKLAQDNSPDKQYAKQQEQYGKDAPKFYDQINGMFQQTLGREATADEKSHFGSLLASGQVDSYGVGQFLNALPEHVQQQDKTFRESLNNDLQTQDARYYKEQILPTLQSDAANKGRSLDASGVQNSFALAAQGQNRQREGFVSNLSASQYAGRQATAQGNYQQLYNQYAGLQDYSRQRAAAASDASMNRVNDISNFNMQKQAYDQYLKNYGKRSSGTGALIGGVIGAGVGAYAGGPAGAQAGYGIGSGLGSYGQSQWG